MQTKSNRKTAMLIGIFFILATAMGILNAGMLGPIIGSADYLVGMSENSGMVMISTFLNVIMAGSVVAIAVVIYPILKKTSETLAIGYLAARIIEGTMLAIGSIAWLALASLGGEFVQAGTPDGSHFQSLGNMLVSASTSAMTLGTDIAFSISALILYYLFIKANLVPKWISIWGLVGGALLLVLGVMKTLGAPYGAVEIAFTAPIALNEMVLAVWLIVKGFNTPNEISSNEARPVNGIEVA